MQGLHLTADLHQCRGDAKWFTDAPGLQFYTGNFLTGTVQGRWAKPFAFRQGFCLEPGLFPDSPNQPDFHRMGYPSGILRPGEAYAQKLVFRFGVSR